MSKPFDKMNKTELVEAITFLKLEDKAIEAAKDPEKITNAEYVQVLEAYKAEQDLANPEEAKAIIVDKAKADAAANSASDSEIVITPRATKAEERKTMVADYNTLIPVIVTDHDTTVSIEEDTEQRVVPIRWGNPVIGMTTVNVAMHGRMQYLQKGAVLRLKKITLASHVKDADGRETSNRDRKRFSVADTTGWTEAEFESHAKEQALKKI